MSYITKTTQAYGVEKDFIKKFVSDLCGLDSRITRGIPDGTPTAYSSNPEEYAALTDEGKFNAWIDQYFSDSNTQTTFYVSVGTGCKIKFMRQAKNSIQTTYYYANVYIYNEGMTSAYLSTSIYFYDRMQNPLAYNVTGTRMYKIAAVSNTKSLIVAIASWDHQSALRGNDPYKVMVTSIESGQDTGVCATTSNVAINTNIIFGENDVCQKVDRLNYTYDTNNAEQLEIIKNKAFVIKNTTDRTRTVLDIWDTSTVTANSLITIGNKKYFCLDAHTIMET